MKLYFRKSEARRAAKAKGNPDAREGVDFLLVEEDGKFGWRPLEMRAPAGPAAGDTAYAPERTPPIVACDPGLKPFVAVLGPGATAVTDSEPAAKPKRLSRRASVKAMVDAAHDRAEALLDRAETLAETAPEWPTSFVPDAENGEIASREYGMLLTRERAVEAAQAAGATDAVITQTCRGIFVWRTSQLDKVWKENQKPLKPEAGKPLVSKRAKPEATGAVEAAKRGELPEPPDFSAPTHKSYRGKLAAVAALIEAGDTEALRSYPIPDSRSWRPRNLRLYRDLAIVALEAKRQAA